MVEKVLPVGVDSKMEDFSSQENMDQSGQGDSSLKRPADDITGSISKKQKVGSIQTKTPIAKLNELKPGLEYKSEPMEGPSHDPVFTVTVEFNGQTFKGTGRSKKQAKHAAAEATLQSIGMDMSVTTEVSEGNKMGDSALTPGEENGTNGNSKAVLKAATNINNASTGATLISQGPTQASKNPVSLLNELRQGVTYRLLEQSGEPHAKSFTFRVIVDEQIFEGTGSSKKLAKAAVAQKVLNDLHGIVVGTSSVVIQDTPIADLPDIQMDQKLADKIAQLVTTKFRDLTAGNPSVAKRKVLAGIIMTNDWDKEDIKVITCSTGTKCINGEHLSLQGQCINDCHAEIVSRRCLVRFLYNQIEKCLDSVRDRKKNNSIIEALEGGKGYRVKPQFKFHLYVNTATCGDGRIFTPHEEEAAKSDNHPNRQSRGQLRTKIESGEGTIPIKTGSDTIQTWDGVLQGERLRTMSCSDKVARWNVLGVQGCLLTHLLTPVYLESVVLGSLFNASHLYRALCGRIEHTVQDLPSLYKLNQPKMSQGSSTIEFIMPTKAPTISVNWYCEDQQLEVLNAMTGRLEAGEMSSRVCKQELFQRLGALLDHPSVKPLTGVDAEAVKQMSYGEVKALCKDYQTSKRSLYSAFSKAGLGKWVSKPLEQEEFYLD